MYYVYLLKSKVTDKYYIGSTRDLKLRFNSHNEGKIQSTKAYTPWDLVCYEAYSSEKPARIREQVLKSHGRTFSSLKQRTKTGKSN